jgi:suppressor for copper-sensitivity B
LFQAALFHPAQAASTSPWAETPQAAARLISAVNGTGQLERLPLGLEFTLQPGWKTYWRSPGDAGLPANVDLTGSRNAGTAQMRWPVPHRFELFGLQTFGYAEHVVLPLDVEVLRPGEPVEIRARLRYLVCEIICIPLEAALALDLPAGPAAPSGEASLINRYSSLVPAGTERLGWLVTAPVTAKDGTIVVDIRSAWRPLQAPDVVIEGSPTHVFNRPRVELSGDGTGVRLTVTAERVADGPALDTQDLTFTLFDGERGAEIVARPLAQASVPDLGFPAIQLLGILGVALLGGLILNIMPCVLPVLILKLTGVIEMSRHENRRLRISFLATAAGILASFLALAGALSLVKLSGAGIGWGIQFQQPLFLAVMVLVCLAFAANLFGLFEIPMPAFVGRASLAADRRVTGEYTKAFMSGVLATALATPCTAPFVGTAVGFALGRGAGEIFLVFAVLGLGLALPYLAVALVPAAVGLLPRPGPWMAWMRRILAVSLIGTSLWLLGVIGGQMGWTGSWVAAGERAPWVKFDEPRIAELVADGQLVFVDVTADWCLTCQANKTLVLDQEPVASRLKGPGMVAMRADWTNPDPRISDFLARFGRYGIPFYVVFGPKAPQGVMLPELLTSDVVMRSIAEAGESP